jgi:hypothetical protein
MKENLVKFKVEIDQVEKLVHIMDPVPSGYLKLASAWIGQMVDDLSNDKFHIDLNSYYQIPIKREGLPGLHATSIKGCYLNADHIEYLKNEFVRENRKKNMFLGQEIPLELSIGEVFDIENLSEDMFRQMDMQDRRDLLDDKLADLRFRCRGLFGQVEAWNHTINDRKYPAFDIQRISQKVYEYICEAKFALKF